MKLGSEQSKGNPLERIQQEINEVARREKELQEMEKQKQQQQNVRNIEPSSNIILKSQTSKVLNMNNKDNTKEVLDETHSDDSGFSTSSSPVNGVPTFGKKHINSNIIKSAPTSQKLLARTISTPQIFQSTNRFTFNPFQKKGIMQRFIASRGKLITSQQLQVINNKDLIKSSYNLNSLNFFGSAASTFIPSSPIAPPIIERDSYGRPIRKGYIPVEEKIQNELKDIKNRETELKCLRKLKLRQSQPNLLDSLKNENLESDEESDVEHCFCPAKLRSSKSISELCDAVNSSSVSLRTTPSPNFEGSMHQSGMRPTVSLAQLCDLDPEEAPSSQNLIAKWENLIQQNS